MHDIKSWLSIIAGIVSVIAYIPLIVAWKNGWEPHRATWTIWIFVTGVITLSMLAKGAYLSALIPGAYFLGTSTISFLSFKRGIGGFEPVDMICASIAVSGMLLWLITGDPLKALLLNILADGCAGLPTVLKLLKNPKSENTLGWFVFSFGGILGVFGADRMTLVTVGYPIFVAFFSGAIALLTLLPQPIIRKK